MLILGLIFGAGLLGRVWDLFWDLSLFRGLPRLFGGLPNCLLGLFGVLLTVPFVACPILLPMQRADYGLHCIRSKSVVEE